MFQSFIKSKILFIAANHLSRSFCVSAAMKNDVIFSSAASAEAVLRKSNLNERAFAQISRQSVRLPLVLVHCCRSSVNSGTCEAYLM